MSTRNLHIQTALTQAQTFAALVPLLQDAHPNITFWGQRYVHIIRHKGTLPIDTLVDHVLKMVAQNFDFNEDERRVGKQIATLIDRLYTLNDEQNLYLNYFTFFLCKLRDCWTRNIEANGYGPRWAWRSNRQNKIFEYYTKTQYQLVFKQDPPEGVNFASNPPRYLSPEALQRAFSS